MNINKACVITLSLASLILSGCQEQGPESGKGKTYTVAEFLHAPDKFRETQKWCMDNPGERGVLPNCVNAAQAQRIIGSGGNLIDCYKNNTVDHECVDREMK